MTKKMDRRVKFTIMMLKDALVKLMQDAPVSSISVKAICELADVNRSTFYAHFEDQFALLRYIEQEAIDNVRNYLNVQDFNDKRPLSFQVLNRILEYIRDNAALFNALLGDNYGSDIQLKLMQMAEIDSFQTYDSVNSRTKEYISVFGLSGCVSILKKWLKDGTPESTTLISELILKILYDGLSSF